MRQISLRWYFRTIVFTAAVMMALRGSPALGQGDATAVQPLALSVFGAGTGTYTDVLRGRNLGITAGADLAFLTYRKLRPVLEMRGNYPVHNGRIDNQRSFLGGLKVERQYGPLHPYANFLVGRGQINYPNGLLFNNLIYLKTVSTVYSPGFGVDYDVTPHWGAKFDFQYQHWDTGAVAGGVIHPKAISLGVTYRFDFNHHPRAPRLRR